MSPFSLALVILSVFIVILVWAVAAILFSERMLEIANRGLPENERFEVALDWTPYKQFQLCKRLLQVWRDRRKFNGHTPN